MSDAAAVSTSPGAYFRRQARDLEAQYSGVRPGWVSCDIARLHAHADRLDKLAAAEAAATPGDNATTPCSPAGGFSSTDLDAARGVVAHPAGHSDDEIAAACTALIERSPRHEDRAVARELFGMLEV